MRGAASDFGVLLNGYSNASFAVYALNENGINRAP